MKKNKKVSLSIYRNYFYEFFVGDTEKTRREKDHEGKMRYIEVMNFTINSNSRNETDIIDYYLPLREEKRYFFEEFLNNVRE